MADFFGRGDSILNFKSDSGFDSFGVGGTFKDEVLKTSTDWKGKGWVQKSH